MAKKYQNKLEKKLDGIEKKYSTNENDKISEIKNLYLGRDETGKKSGKLHKLINRYNAVEESIKGNDKELSKDEKACLSEYIQAVKEHDSKLDKKRKDLNYSKVLKQKRETHTEETLDGLIGKYTQHQVPTEQDKIPQGQDYTTIDDTVEENPGLKEDDLTSKFDLTSKLTDAKYEAEKDSEGPLTKLRRGIGKYRKTMIAGVAALALGLFLAYSLPKKFNLFNKKPAPIEYTIQNPIIHGKKGIVNYKGSNIKLPPGSYLVKPGKGKNVDGVKVDIPDDGYKPTSSVSINVKPGKFIELDQKGIKDGKQVASSKLKIEGKSPETKKGKPVLKINKGPLKIKKHFLKAKDRPIIPTDELNPEKDEKRDATVYKLDTPGEATWLINFRDKIAHSCRGNGVEGIVKTQWIGGDNSGLHVAVDDVSKWESWWDLFRSRLKPYLGLRKTSDAKRAQEIIGNKGYILEDPSDTLNRWIQGQIKKGYVMIEDKKLGIAFLYHKDSAKKHGLTIKSDDAGGVFPKKCCSTIKWDLAPKVNER